MRSGAGDRSKLAAASTFLVGVAVMLLCAPAATARDKPGIEVRDMHYGEVLFHFYQQDDFTALNHLLAARYAGRISHHDEESELLLGGLFLAYGQHRQAGEIFDRLLSESADKKVRDRAWFYLGKVRFQRGLFADAEAALRQVGKKLPKRLAAEHKLLLAQSLMNQDRFDEAATVLEQWKGPGDWTAYARLNLGVAFVRAGRLADGAAALDRVGRISTRSDELRSLRDKANLALGYAFLQSEQPEAARDVLSRVRINGPFSNKALLGVGWADALQADYRNALVPWLELRDRDLLDSAVQESLLAVPYAFGRLQAHGSAVEHYLTAIGAFDTEIARIDQAIERARTGELVPALLQTDDPDIGRWYWQLQDVPDNADARYLYHLVANHDFQDGLRNFRDLLALGGYLRDWSTKLDTFEDILDTRTQAYEQRVPVVEASFSAENLQELHARRDALAARLDEIARERDVAGLATTAERQQWELLSSLEDSPAWSHAGAADARDKHRLLKGLLAWNLDRDYKLRLWQQRSALGDLDQVIARADAAAAKMNAVKGDIPAEIDGYRARLAELRPRLDRMQSGVTVALGGQREHLQMLAVTELEAQRERLATYRVQARFALATIYDRANATAANQEPQP
ncbi:MAG: tetratricopeptide repeat protein [Gammaproteobacteria bacterium]|nr:tetratricopeptide repeat protein [Gammaproteobacteria bacterium]